MTLPISLIYLVSFLAAFFLGTVVLFQNPAGKNNQLLTVLILTIIGWQITLFLFYLISDPTLVLWLGRINFVFAEFMAFSIFLFCFLFPTELHPNKRKYLYFLAGVTTILAILTIFSPLIIENELIVGSSDRETVFGPLYPFFVFHFLLFTLGGIAILFEKINKLSGLQRQQAQYLVLGQFFAIIFGSITNIFLPLIFGVYSLQHTGLFAPLIFVAFATYAIIRHRLFDIRILVARTISHSLLVLILGFLYSFSLFVVGSWLFSVNSTTSGLIYSTALALILAYTFHPLRKTLEETTDNIFYKGGYETEDVLKKLNKLLVSTYLVKKLLNNILIEIKNTIKLEKIEIVLIRNNHIELHLSQGKNKETSSLTYKDTLLLKKYADVKEIIFEDLEENKVKALLRERKIKLVFPLKTKDNFIGFLLVGDKLSGDIHSQQDIRLLELFSPELSLAIQNAEAFDEISKFNVTLKKKITEATNDLKAANKQLKELDQLKDEFLSIASHELRTPMTAIRSYLWMVLEEKAGDINDKQKYYLSRSYKSTERLIKLVNDMLNVSRIEAGGMLLEVNQVNMRGVCLEVISELKPKADNSGLELNFKTFEEDGKTSQYLVAANADKIKEVLFNLVGNSLKFTPKGGSVTVSLQKKGDQIITQVKDTGVGIDAENKENLFQKFGFVKDSYRANQDNSQGKGLGLYICKSIIELHNGEIWVDSPGKNQGSTFSFSLPVYSRETLRALKNKGHKTTQ